MASNQPKLYYPINFHSYDASKKTQKLVSAIIDFENIIYFFYQKYSKKLTVTFLPLNLISTIIRILIKLKKIETIIPRASKQTRA